MDIRLFERICAQLEGLCDAICLHILGDPLEVKNFFDYADIAARFGLKIDLVSTAKTLKTSDFDRLLSPPFHQISISLSASLIKKNGFKEGHIDRVLALCKRAAELKSDTFINLRYQCASPADATKIRLARKIFLLIKPTFEWPDGDLAKADGVKFSGVGGVGEKICYALKDHFGILADGRVVPCCLDFNGTIVLGDAARAPLRAILTSPKAAFIRQSLAQKRPPHPLCQTCGFVHFRSG